MCSQNILGKSQSTIKLTQSDFAAAKESTNARKNYYGTRSAVDFEDSQGEGELSLPELN